MTPAPTGAGNSRGQGQRAHLAKDAPVLTLHGAADTLVPVTQGRRLREARRAARVEEHLEIIPSAGHGFGGAAGEHAWALALEFLDWHLHP